MRRAGLALLIGLAVTAPITALLFLASRLGGLPFVPFSLFEAATRVLPGALVTRGIEAMVGFLGLVHLSVRATAKLAEEALAVMLFFVGCIVVALILQLAWAWLGTAARRVRVAGATSGVLLGGAVAGFSLGFGPAPQVGAAAVAAWVVAMGAVWGERWGGPGRGSSIPRCSRPRPPRFRRWRSSIAAPSWSGWARSLPP